MPRRSARPGPRRALAGSLALVLAGGAQAATIQVDTVDDDVQQGIIGTCSLREALIAANRNIAVDGCRSGAPGADVVRIPAGSYVLTAAAEYPEEEALRGDLDVTEDVTIEGAGFDRTVVDAARIDRVVEVKSTATATIRDLSLTGGGTSVDSVGGGGLLNRGRLTLERVHVYDNRTDRARGGGIGNLGTLTLVSSDVRGNSTQPLSYMTGEGGGIWSSGTLTVIRSLISDNRASGWYGGSNFYVTAGLGGGIHNTNQLELIDSEVLRNEAVGGAGVLIAAAPGYGGGLRNSGTATITGSTIGENTARSGSQWPTAIAYGGGIHNVGTLEISRSLIRDNRALGFAGTDDDNSAVSGGGILTVGPLTITNSTLSGNAAIGGMRAIGSGQPAEGGGLFVGPFGDTELTHVTFAGNVAQGGRGGFGVDDVVAPGTGGAARGGAVHALGGNLHFANTLIAGNEAIGGAGGPGDGTPDGPIGDAEGNGCFGTFIDRSLGGNVEQPDDSCGLDDPSDQVALSTAEVALGTLGSNGGPTWTHPLEAGSFAIDAGGAEHCPVDDQRRYGRTDGACDTGAFEAGATPLCTDADGDGYAIEGESCGPVDCDDANPDVNPGAAEIPANGVDDDCDPTTPVAGCANAA